MRSILLIFMACCSGLHGFESQQMTDILPYVGPNSLVLFDIDNTLIQPAHQLGCSAWVKYYSQKLMDEGWDPQEAWDEACTCYACVLRCATMELVDSTTPAVIETLQRCGVTVMGLTSRAPLTARSTYTQLLEFGIDLAATAPNPNVELRDLPGVPKFYKGIIFCSYKIDKGTTLINYLKATGHEFDHVLFVDDRARQVVSVQKAMEEANIPFTGLRYSRSDEAARNFDPEIAEIQWQRFCHILSDREAKRLLQR